MNQVDSSLARLQRTVHAAEDLLNETSNSGGTRAGVGGASFHGETTLQWVLRFTWEVVRGLSHPKHTYAERATESQAIDHAVYMMDHYDNGGSVRLVEVHVKGPGRDWTKVE